jgi:hypothetical protein
MNYFLLLLSFCTLSARSIAQNTTDTDQIAYVRMQLNDLTSQEQVQQIDQLIRSKAGVLLTRTDDISDTFYARFLLSSGLNENQFQTWITSLGYQVNCSVIGLAGEPLKSFPEDCSKRHSLNTTK